MEVVADTEHGIWVTRQIFLKKEGSTVSVGFVVINRDDGNFEGEGIVSEQEGRGENISGFD